MDASISGLSSSCDQHMGGTNSYKYSFVLLIISISQTVRQKYNFVVMGHRISVAADYVSSI